LQRLLIQSIRPNTILQESLYTALKSKGYIDTAEEQV
jgi:hypothetical protein